MNYGISSPFFKQVPLRSSCGSSQLNQSLSSAESDQSGPKLGVPEHTRGTQGWVAR